MPFLEGHAQLFLFDRKGRAPVGQCAPKGDWHSWELNLLIQHCPDGVVQVVSTRGVAVSIAGCRLTTGSPGSAFIVNLDVERSQSQWFLGW